jgi:hypothetical protein
MTAYWRNRVSEQKMGTRGTRSADIWIGAVGDEVREPVRAGLIDDVRVVGGILTAEQIAQIRDNVGEVGALPKLFGEHAPPDIGNGTGTEITADQQALMADSGPDLDAATTPTSVMPSGGTSSSLSQTAVDQLQQARDESAPLDIIYGSEEEGEAAAAAAEALRQQQAEEPGADNAGQRGYEFSTEVERSPLSGFPGATSIPIDLVDEHVTGIWIGHTSLPTESHGGSRIRIHGADGGAVAEGVTGAVVSSFSIARESLAIGNIQVCTGRSDTPSVSGLMWEGNFLREDGTFGEYVRQTEELPSCRNAWYQESRCPLPLVATGVVAHFGSSRNLVGLQLLCRRVVPIS